MALIETIKADMIAARKQKSPTAGTLVTLKGEIDTKERSFSPARPITDDEIVAIVKKFIKNVDENLRLLADSGKDEVIQASKDERTALEVYLPAQMSEDAIAAFARVKKASGANMGAIMGALKAEKAGQYDGKLASGVVKAVLAE